MGMSVGIVRAARDDDDLFSADEYSHAIRYEWITFNPISKVPNAPERYMCWPRHSSSSVLF
jgi:hypothetical protein